MTTATTRQAIRRELYNQIPGLGLAGTLDSVTTTTIVSISMFADSTLGGNHYRGYYIYRPDRTGNDVIKKANTLATATGAITHAGSNYSNTTDLNVELVGAMHPDELNQCIQRAMTRLYFETQVPLTGDITDGDMDANNTTSWTSNGLATMEKVTMAARVYSGIRSLHTLANSANDNAQSVTVKLGTSSTDAPWVYASAVVHADVGTARLILYDVTNSTNLATVDSTSEGWSHLWLKFQVPTTCEEVALRLDCVGTTDDLYWNHALLYPLNQLRFGAPSWLDDPFKFLKLREAAYARPLSSQTNGGYDDATSRYFKDWLTPQHFSLDPFHTESNPYAIQLNRVLPVAELWIEGKRPWSDLEALSTESATTLAPLRLVYAYAREEIARILRKRFPADKRWEVLLAEAVADVMSETMSRTEVPLQPIKREVWGRI